MSTIVIDADMRAKLLAAKGVIVFKDDTGNIIGRFVPKLEVLMDENEVSLEELDRRVREDPKFSTEEVLARLRSLRR